MAFELLKEKIEFSELSSIDISYLNAFKFFGSSKTN